MCDPIAEYAKEFYWPEVLAERRRADLAEKKAAELEKQWLLIEKKSEETIMAANKIIAEADEIIEKAKEITAKAKEIELTPDARLAEAILITQRTFELIEDLARLLLQSDFSLEETAEKTGLSMEKVQEIAAGISKSL